MKKELIFFLAGIFLICSIAPVLAEYSIDISGLKQSYSVGEKITYTVLLLNDNVPANVNLEVVFSDDFGQKQIKQTVTSNTLNSLSVDSNFSSLGWQVQVSYAGKQVSRSFTVLKNSAVDFTIEGDKLIIRNMGNVRYTRDVEVKIGDVTNVYTQNIPVGGEKIWTLVAPKGSYRIQVSDGQKTITQDDVLLNSEITGNAIGAVGQETSITGLLSPPIDPNNIDKSLIPTGTTLIACIFIVAVVLISALLFVEKKLRRKNQTKRIEKVKSAVGV